MNEFFLGAAAGSVFIAGLHCVLGGREIAAPLLRSRDMHAVAKYTNYYCWHMVTIVLVAMAGSFAWSAMVPGAVELAGLATILAGAFCLWSFARALWKRQKLLQMPQWLLFLGVFLLALPGF